MRVVSRCVAFRCGGACAWMLALKNGGNALRVEKMDSHGGSERKWKMGSAGEGGGEMGRQNKKKPNNKITKKQGKTN